MIHTSVWTPNPATDLRFFCVIHRKDYGCHPGSWGADFVEPIKELTSHACAQVVEKHTFDAFFERELRGFLRFKQIDTVYIAGIETNVCVLFTACSALSNGFDTIILVECVTTSHTDVREKTLQIIERAKGRLMSTRTFLTLLESQPSLSIWVRQ